MKKTALYDHHLKLGGRMVDFAGWQLPVQYSAGPLAEHHAVRTAAGLFDIDHMGQFRVRGPDTEQFLQWVQVRDISSMAENEANYGLLLYGDGTIVDDIFLYRLSDSWLVVVNAANRAKDLEWLQAHAVSFDVEVEDVSDDLYMIALQGPQAEHILQTLVTPDLGDVAARTALNAEIAGVRTLIGRTGYTGEDGFELYIPAENIEQVWNAIMKAGEPHGLLPCGLAARDSLRFEACLALYGHEINASTTPVEARLNWVVSWDKDFIGRTALLKTKLEQSESLLVGLEMLDRAVPREGYAVASDGQGVGHVTTGMKSPTLDRFLALAYVPRALSKLGTEVDVIVRGQPKRAKVVKRPFYQPRYK